jgi:hypothetical protein
MTKKETIQNLSNQEPKLTRAEIARQAECSTAYVTQTLGAVRPYKRAGATQEDQPVPEAQTLVSSR